MPCNILICMQLFTFYSRELCKHILFNLLTYVQGDQVFSVSHTWRNYNAGPDLKKAGFAHLLKSTFLWTLVPNATIPADFSWVTDIKPQNSSGIQLYVCEYRGRLCGGTLSTCLLGLNFLHSRSDTKTERKTDLVVQKTYVAVKMVWY